MAPSPRTLKILSWNVRQGGGSRVPEILAAVVAHEPHVVVLSEFRNNRRGTSLRAGLSAAGFGQQVVTEAGPHENSVLIASGIPFAPQFFADRVDVYPHAMARAAFPAFDVHGVYLPHKKKHGWFEVILEEMTRNRPAVFTGDFNSGKNFIDQAGNSFWYTDEIDRIETLGYVDAFRLINGDRKEYSWFSHQGRGYRYDHTFVSPELEPLLHDCYYSHEERERGVSDHSVMLLELSVPDAEDPNHPEPRAKS